MAASFVDPESMIQQLGQPGAMNGMQGQEASLQQPFPAPTWAPHVEQGDWRTKGIVDPERAASITEEDVIHQVMERESEARNARQSLEQQWVGWDNLYFLRCHDTEKQSWQSDIVVPQVFNTVRSLISFFRQGIFGTGRWFRLLERTANYNTAYLRAIERWMRYVAEKGDFPEESIKTVEQALILGTSVMSTGIDEAIIMRPGVEQIPIYADPQMAFQAAQQGMPTSRPQVSISPEAVREIRCRWRDLRNVFFDPYAETPRDLKYIIEKTETDEDDLEDRQRAGLYDSIDDIGQGVRIRNDYASFYSRTELTENRSKRNRHLITEYTGNLYDSEGKLAARNWIVTIANERKILRIGPNPLWSGRSRYVFCVPMPYPGRIYGRSIIETDADVQEEITQLTNLIIDDTKFATLGVFQSDSENTEEPEEITGVWPGMVVHGDMSHGDILRKLQFASNSAGALPVLSMLQNIASKATRVTEWVDGTGTSRGRPSAAEAKIKSSAGSAYLDDMVQNVEKTFFVPGLEAIYEYLMIFGGNLSDPELREILGDIGGPETLLDDAARLAFMSNPFKVMVQGASMLMDRDDLQQRLMSLMQMLGQFGLMQVSPMIMLEIVYAYIETLGLDPVRFGMADSPQEMQMMMMGLQQQPAPGEEAAPEEGGSGSAPAGGSPSSPGQASGGGSAPPSSPPPQQGGAPAGATPQQ